MPNVEMYVIQWISSNRAIHIYGNANEAHINAII